MFVVNTRGQRKLGRQPQEGTYEYYCRICTLQNVSPVEAAKTGIESGALCVNVRRLRADDWSPLLRLVATPDNGLRTISVQGGDGKAPPNAGTAGRRLDAKTTGNLCAALRTSLGASSSLLHHVALRSVRLRPDDVAALAGGLHGNATLRALSLRGCRLGDAGFAALMHGFAAATALVSLDVSGCKLGEASARLLAATVARRGATLQTRAWQASLRWRDPNLTAMSGVRHLRLNDNPALGDGAARVIADALRDDLWLKVVEMQACGVTSSGVAALADALAVNTTLSVFDVASNDVAAPALASLRAALQRNSHADMPLEYEELLIAEKAERAHAGTRPATAVRKATGPRDGHAGRAPAARRPVTSTAKKLHAPLSNTRTSSRPKSASARSCGANMARDVTALRSQVAALRAEAAEKEKALSEERRLRVAAERKRDELIADNEFLRREVGSIREEARHARGRGEDDADLADVHATITQFHKFLDLLHTVVPDRR